MVIEPKKITVQRANVVLQIHEQQLDYYLNQGFNVIDEKGEIIQESIPRDVGTLQKMYVEHTNEIKSLKEEIEALKEELARRNSRKKKTDEKPEDEKADEKPEE